jgi:hypothetical protein
MRIYKFFIKFYTQRESKRITIDVHDDLMVYASQCNEVEIRDWVIDMVLYKLEDDFQITTEEITSIFVDENGKIIPRDENRNMYKVVNVIIKLPVAILPQEIDGHLAYKIINKNMTRVDCNGHVTANRSPKYVAPSPEKKSHRSPNQVKRERKDTRIYVTLVNINKNFDANSKCSVPKLTKISAIDASLRIICLMFDVIGLIESTNIKHQRNNVMNDLLDFYKDTKTVGMSSQYYNTTPITIIKNILNYEYVNNDNNKLYIINTKTSPKFPPFELDKVIKPLDKHTDATILNSLEVFFNELKVNVSDDLPQFLIFALGSITSENMIVSFNLERISEYININYGLIGMITFTADNYNYYTYNGYSSITKSHSYLRNNDESKVININNETPVIDINNEKLSILLYKKLV